MTEPRDPQDYGFKPPLTARRGAPPTREIGRLASQATPSMPPFARAHQLSSKGSVLARPADPFGRGRDGAGDGQGAGRANDAGREEGLDDPYPLFARDSLAQMRDRGSL